jgi:hypothetical protein
MQQEELLHRSSRKRKSNDLFRQVFRRVTIYGATASPNSTLPSNLVYHHARSYPSLSLPKHSQGIPAKVDVGIGGFSIYTTYIDLYHSWMVLEKGKAPEALKREYRAS